jgi:hypothetical protein
MARTRTYILESTLKELIEATRYTFEVGQSYNRKINLAPKAIKGFVSNYEKALEEKQGCPVEVTYVEITA